MYCASVQIVSLRVYGIWLHLYLFNAAVLTRAEAGRPLARKDVALVTPILILFSRLFGLQNSSNFLVYLFAIMRRVSEDRLDWQLALVKLELEFHNKQVELFDQ